MTTKSRPGDLLDLSWFEAEMPEPERDRLAGLARVATFEAGHVLSREGEPVTDLGVVLTGRLALRTHVPGRGPLTILTVEPGDVFDWSALVPPYVASATLVAVEPVEAMLFEAEALRAAISEDPRLAAVVYPRLLRAAARRLSATRLQLLDLFASGAGSTW